MTTTAPLASASVHPAREVADALADTLRGVPGVAALHPGRFGEVSLLYPRHRVNGLRLAAGRLEVHVTVDLDARRPLADTAAEIRGVVKQLLDAPVDVHFVDATSGGLR